MKKFKIAIVGATGAVGREMLRCVFQFNFPFESIKLLASARSAGKEIEFEGHKFVVEELTENSFEGVEVAFWSAGGSISEKYMKYAVEAGCVNIDNTSHFRMDPNVPLVVPEVNGEALKDHHGIISCPNCTTIMMCSALTRLNDEFDIERIVVSTYQAVSGAGVAGMEELYRQSQEVLDGKEPVAKTLFGNCKVDGFFLEYDSERAGGFEPLRYIQDQKVILGLVTSKDAKLENKEEIIKRIHEAEKYVPLNQLALSPQCGFASCEIGNKLTEEQQWAKLKLVKEIAEEVWG